MTSSAHTVSFRLSGLDKKLWSKLHILLQMAVSESARIGVKRYQTSGIGSTFWQSTSDKSVNLTETGKAVMLNDTMEPFTFGTHPNKVELVRIYPDSSLQSFVVTDDNATIIMAWLIVVAEDYPEAVTVNSTATVNQWRKAQGIAFHCGYTKRKLPFESVVLSGFLAAVNPPAHMDFRA